MDSKIRAYILRRYPVVESKGLADDEPLADILDSLAVLGLVGFIEAEFSIEFSPSDLTDENFESISTISQLVTSLICASS